MSYLEVSEEEQRILQLYRSLNKHHQETFLSFMDSLKSLIGNVEDEKEKNNNE